MNNIKSFDPKSLSQPELHQFLLTAVAPRPIALASTIDKDGKVNLAPFSFFNVFSSNPPILIFSPARSGRDNSTKHTYQNVKKVSEVVVNIVNFDIVEQMSLSSTAYDKGINEFEKAGFSEVASTLIKPPRVAEAPVSLECKVNKVIELGENPGAGNLIIAEVIMMHAQARFLDEKGKLDTRKLDLVARMGGSDYCRALPESLFEIPKPIRQKGIGVDRLPEHVRESDVLTGNNLGRLGNIEEEPTFKEIEKVKNTGKFKSLLDSTNPIADLHIIVKQHLEKGESKEALVWAFAIP